MSKNIYIIGFMASGKTLYGKKLAKYLSYNYIDLDQLIEEEQKKSIPELFDEFGESHFRQLEKDALEKSFLSENTVYSLGGGTPCFFDTMQKINEQGISIYFKAKAGVLANRLTISAGTRPLVLNKSAEEIKQFVEDLLPKREIYYQQAKIVCDATNINISLIAKAIETYSKE
jgi:shikimate kinase